MSVRFAVTVLLLLASFAGLFELGRGEWGLHQEQRRALSRIKPPEYFDDAPVHTQGQAAARPSESA